MFLYASRSQIPTVNNRCIYATIIDGGIESRDYLTLALEHDSRIVGPNDPIILERHADFIAEQFFAKTHH
jgi:hypothetical protein